MQEKEIVPAHSVRGYLNRQSTEKLKMVRDDYLRRNSYQIDRNTFLMILEVLQSRGITDTDI